jgi:hypothetical protein
MTCIGSAPLSLPLMLSSDGVEGMVTHLAEPAETANLRGA